MSVSLDVKTAACSSAIYLQNHCSLLTSLVLQSDESLSGLRVLARYTPDWVKDMEWTVENLPAGEAISLPLPEPVCNWEKLSALTEEERGAVSVSVMKGAEMLAEAQSDFRWLPRMAWAGAGCYPELLASLVLPNDPAVDMLLGEAADYLKKSGKNPSWVGYQDDPVDILAKLHAIWTCLRRHSINYALPPRSWLGPECGQKLRSPSRILQGGCGTCLDLTALLAAVVAQAGLDPLVLLLPSHAFLGVWLKPQKQSPMLQREPSVIRNAMQLGDILLLECTAMTSSAEGNGYSFSEAAAAANANMEKLQAGEEFTALDLARAWESGLKPIAQLGESGAAQPLKPASGAALEDEDEEDYLSAMPKALLEAEQSLVAPRKRSRMENWQLKLLDMSKSNNLLNCRFGSSQIGLRLPDVAGFEDELVNGKSFSIKLLPESFLADVASGADEACKAAYARQQSKAMFSRDELMATRSRNCESDEQLQKRLYKLYLDARRSLEESGYNTLYVACSFLKWTAKDGRGERSMLAPLLLLPVQLKRRSAKSEFKLSGLDDDPCINMTLLELLKTEYSLRIPELEGELPKDESGLDVPLILRYVRQAIRDIPGWEVVELCSLGIFSFAKYLMWKDMSDRREALERNAVVQHMAADQRELFPAQVDFPEPAKLDSDVDAAKVFTPLSSDSSQLSAVLAAGRGKNFVLIGPPGTGKSQTIANMIAHCLGHGKTVLFVAEKAAALSVVYKRLKRIGLGDFCLEMHSSKANKKDFVAQFRSSLAQLQAGSKMPRWDDAVQMMAQLRQQLNELPQQMHARLASGGSLYEDVCTVAEGGAEPHFQAYGGDILAATRDEKEAMLAQAERLALYFTPVADAFPGAATAVGPVDYSSAWEQKLAELLTAYDAATRRRDALWDRLMADLGLPQEQYAGMEGPLQALLETAKRFYGKDSCALLPARAQNTRERAARLQELAKTYQEQRRRLSLNYPAEALDEPMLDLWWRDWREGQISNFISRFFKNLRLRKQLRLLAFSREKPDIGGDLQALLEMRKARDAVRVEQLDTLVPHLLKGLESTEAEFALVEALLKDFAEFKRISSLAAQYLSIEGNPMRPASALDMLLDELHEADKECLPLQQELGQCLAKPLGPEECGRSGRAAAWTESLLALRGRWRELCLWGEAAHQALTAGCGSLVEVLLLGIVKPKDLLQATRVNFARRRLAAAVDASKSLRSFTPHTHEAAIAQFGKKDAELLQLAGKELQALLTQRAAAVSNYPKELAVLQHEVSKQQRYMAPRRMLALLPHVAPLLKPCMLMSPLSVAQYLEPDSEPYDIVIFDEASQIPVWDAIGAIARGKSAVIVGDPRQMPPTSFFSCGKKEGDDDDEELVEQDMESILDECRACGIPEMKLTWHYRSKSENLIAFSNHNYYEGSLTTFPAPLSSDSSLQYHYVKGVYNRGAKSKGKKSTNPIEARAVVDHVLQTLRSPGFVYSEASSIGIVTFNMQQQSLIQDMLEDELAKDESLEPFFAESNPEAVFVKNLESVQGDERGVIYFSTTFGPDEQGAMSMNFGPLNQVGGERRLNVAITRARAGMHVFSSMKPEEINLSRTKARGVADLRGFLDCAARGPQQYFAGKTAAKAAASAGLAQVIAAALSERGWVCSTQVGVASERLLDIAVQHPDYPDTLLAGIVLDSPSYARAATARDRDVLRGSVLKGMGWNICNVWSLDWWRQPDICLASLEKKLKDFQAQGPLKRSVMPSILPTEQAK